jgi:hypothetical protein
VALSGAPVPGGPDAIRHAARQILSRPEFRPTPQTPVERLRHWVVTELSRLLGDVLTATPHGVLGALLVAGVVGALVVVIVRAVRGTASSAAWQGYALGGPTRSAADWLADAARYEAAGDWRAGVRCRYRALVAELARRGLVEEIPGRTTGEYRRAVVESLPAGAGPFGGATDLFEVVWYGDEPVGAEAAARLRRLSDDVLDAVG